MLINISRGYPRIRDKPGHGIYRPIQIRSVFNFLQGQESLVAHWRFNEASGQLINYAPSTLGLLEGTPSSVSQGVATSLPRIPLAYSFDGADDKVTVSNNAALAGLGDHTWAVLINLASEGEGGIGRILSWNALWFLRNFGSAKYRYTVDYDGTDANGQSGAGAMPLSTWHWFITGLDATTKHVLMYQGLNGLLSSIALATDTQGVGTLQAPTEDLILGNNAATTATIDGDIAYMFALNVAPDTVEDVLQRVVTLSGA